MAGEFGTGKTVLVLAIVAGCFAVLWPKLIYPMLQSAVNVKTHADTSSSTSGCCDVIFENDVNAIKIMSEMCGNILHRYDDFDPKLTLAFQQGKLSPEIVYTCRKAVLDTCGIDITAFLNDRVRLGKTYKQILDEIRSFNSSTCLKRNFGVDPGLLGAPHRMKIGVLNMPSHHRQERPPHLRPDLLNNHPALQERGRTIPQSHIVPKVIEKEGRPPGPIPGMRPPMGGAGHVVPPPKGAGGGGTMGIIMPLYTIGIIVFFMYTMMKMVFKKVAPQAAAACEEFTPDPVFRRMVFAEAAADGKPPPPQTAAERNGTKKTVQDTAAAAIALAEKNGTKLVVTAIRGLLAEVDQHRQVLAERSEGLYGTLESEIKGVDEIISSAEKLISSTEPTAVVATEPPSSQATEQVTVDGDSRGCGAKVKIVGMEMTASCEGGQRWSRPSTPVLISSNSRSSTPLPPPTPEPMSIFLEGALPAQSQLLVTESETQTLPLELGEMGSDTDPPVILSGKMTLSLISIDGALAAEDEHRRRRAADEKRRAEEAASALREESTPVPADGDDEEVEEVIMEEKAGNGSLVNNVHLALDDTPTSTNYTTATSAAAEATGPEETAADFSAIESFLPDDQEEEDDLEDEEEVWNGDIDSGEDEEESEEEEAEGIPQVNQNQHQR